MRSIIVIGKLDKRLWHALSSCANRSYEDSVPGRVFEEVNKKSEGTANILTNIEFSLRDRMVIVGTKTRGLWLEVIRTQILPAYLTTLEKHLPVLEKIFQLTDLRRVQGCNWRNLMLPTVAGWIMDLGVGENLREETGAVLEYGCPPLILVFEGGTESSCSFGIRIQKDPLERLFFGELWYQSLKKIPNVPLNIDVADFRLLVHLLSAQCPQSLNQKDYSRSQAKLIFLGVLRRAHNRCVLAVPVVVGSDLDILLPIIREISGELWKLISTAGSRLARTSRGEACLGKGEKIAFSRLVLEHALENAMTEGLLPHPPEHARVNWGTWIASGGPAQTFFGQFS